MTIIMFVISIDIWLGSQKSQSYHKRIKLFVLDSWWLFETIHILFFYFVNQWLFSLFNLMLWLCHIDLLLQVSGGDSCLTTGGSIYSLLYGSSMLYVFASYKVSRNHTSHFLVTPMVMGTPFWLYPENKAYYFSFVGLKLVIQNKFTSYLCNLTPIINFGLHHIERRRATHGNSHFLNIEIKFSHNNIYLRDFDN
jgi:hypothetical protein